MVMDPHSRLSQYNQRPPKSGPLKPLSRQMEPKTVAVFEQFKKPTQSSTVKNLVSLPTRPIATNSRLKRDDKYKRDMYLAFVENALAQKAKGVTEHYDDLVRQFNPKTFSQESQQPLLQLRSYLAALTHVVSKLDKAHLALVDAIVGMPWTTMDSAFVKAYVSFICMLVSARPEYLMLVLERTAQALTYSSARKALDSGFPESSATPITRRVVYERVHSLLDQLICVIPTLPSTLYPLLSRTFPHKRQSQAEHVTYIRNLLRLTDYCPELWERVLGLIVDRTIQIDVEIQVELEDLESDGLADGEVFHLDVFDTVIGQEGDDSESEEEDEDGGMSDISSDAGSIDGELEKTEEQDVKHVQDMVTKLDSILEVIFKHFDQLQTSALDERPDTPTSSLSPALSRSPAQRQALSQIRFHSLLSIFERTILRTFKSRYTQFLVFWYSSLDTQFRDHFLGTVVSKALLEPEQPVVTRAAAASYVASYVSRASFVDRAETRNVIAILCKFLETHLVAFDAYQAQSTNKNKIAAQQSSEQHAVFYASAQAVFLIFCFRWRDLMEQDSDRDVDDLGVTLNITVASHRTWQPELAIMQRVVNSALNPLKVCSAPVVQQFARIAQKVGFIYCFPIIEANRRLDYSTSSRSTSLSSIFSASMSQSFDADLTTFFPFDPYKLPKSSLYIDGIYREWTSVAIEESDDDGDSDVEEEEEDADDESADENAGDELTINEELNLRVHGSSGLIDGAAGLGESFGGMSISPAHPKKVDLSL